MSYQQPNTGNSLNDYFTNLVAFNQCSPHLLESENLEQFVVWFDKLRLIDRRALLLFLRQHKNEIPKQHIEYAQRHFTETI